ncbi:MAG: hypothetical protein R2755_04260 [Acidimicrobiales bacterium]
MDLGHTVDVLGGQPYPILDERVPLIRLPSLDIYNDHYPMRMPGWWELKTWPDWVEAGVFMSGLPPNRSRSRCGRGGTSRPPTWRTATTWSTTTSASATACWGSSALASR